MPTLADIQTWHGQDAVGPDGDRIGSFDHVYVDRETGAPTFAAVKTGLFGHKVSLVPIDGARHHEEHVHLAYSKAKIADAPNVDADGELSEAEEEALYAYYDQTYSSYDGPDHEALIGLSTSAHGHGTVARDARLRRYVEAEQRP